MLLAAALTLCACRDRTDGAPTPTPTATAQPDLSEAAAEPEPSEPAREPPTSLVVHSVAELEGIDLSMLERLDLSLSPAERVGQLDDAPGSGDACAGLDLVRLAERLPRLRSLRMAGCQTAIHVGLGQLAPALRELELVDVVLDGVTVGRVSQLSHLESLALTRVTLGTDPLTPLGELPIRRVVLRELENDSPVAQLLGLWPRTLDEVTLEGAWAGHKAMISLAKAKRLSTLSLADTRIGNYSLNQIKPLSRLRTVRLSGAGFNDNTPLYLRHLPVAVFECACPSLGDNGLRQLRHVKTLREIVLPESAASPAGIAHLAELEKLASIEIRDRPVGSTTIAELAKLPQLRRLVLGGTPLDELELGHLDELSNLEVLELTYPNLDDRVATSIGKLIRLRELNLGGTRISDAGLEPLAKLQSLRILRLHHTRVTNRGLAHVGKIPSLEVLELDHTDVVDEGVRHLRTLTGLRELRLDSTLVTDRSLDVLEHLEALERLNLANTVVSAAAAERLRALPNLASLNLHGTRGDR